MATAKTDWGLLAKALDWYSAHGFRRLELPWHARKETVDITCPRSEMVFPLKGFGVLVGSAEQAFMEAQFEGRLPKGRWLSLTPCFRAEPVLDDLHLPYFMKVELYSNENLQEGLDLEFARTAATFMRLHGAPNVGVVKTDEGWDLEIGGIEVGSYSTREHAGHCWTCGTGLAEPRFSTAIERLDQGRLHK